MKTRARVTHCQKAPEAVLLYTKTQMAALLQVSLTRLNQMMRDGTISYLKIGGKQVRFRSSHVLRRLRETSFVCHGGAEDGGRRTEDRPRTTDN